MNSIAQMCESLEKARDEAVQRIKKSQDLHFEARAASTCVFINHNLANAKDKNLVEKQRRWHYQCARRDVESLVDLADRLDASKKGESE